MIVSQVLEEQDPGYKSVAKKVEAKDTERMVVIHEYLAPHTSALSGLVSPAGIGGRVCRTVSNRWGG